MIVMFIKKSLLKSNQSQVLLLLLRGKGIYQLSHYEHKNKDNYKGGGNQRHNHHEVIIQAKMAKTQGEEMLQNKEEKSHNENHNLINEGNDLQLDNTCKIIF